MKTKKEKTVRAINMLVAALLVMVLLAGIVPEGVMTAYASETVGGTKEDENGSDKDGTYRATLHVYERLQTDGSLIESIYEYVSLYSPLLLLYDRGLAYGNHLIGGSSGSFYLLSADGETYAAPKLKYVKRMVYDADGKVTSEENYSNNTSLKTVYCDYYWTSARRTCSVSVDGDYKVIAYNSNVWKLDGTKTYEGISYVEVAAAMMSGQVKHPLIKASNAFFCDLNSRSLGLHGGYLFWNENRLLGSVLSEGKWSHEGTGYSDTDAYKKGIRVVFSYKGGNKTMQHAYYYHLPLYAASYELNLADIKKVTYLDLEYTLSAVSFTPVYQKSVSSHVYSSGSEIYNLSELEAAGCFEKGGNPIVLSDTPDKSDGNDGGFTGDPSLGDGDGEQHKLYPEVPLEEKWDDTEHGFFENVLNYLKNIARNIAALAFSIPEKISGFFKSFQTFVSETSSRMSSLFVPKEDITAKYKAVMNEKFPLIKSSGEFMEDLKKRLGSLGRTVPSISVPFSKIWNGRVAMADVKMSFEWFIPYREDWINLMSGILWAFFCVHQYFGLKHLFNATGSDAGFFIRNG